MAGSIKEIARLCGVSEGTVDRALNNRAGIKEETKQRILATAKKLNYQPNHLARCLATGCTKTIGVVCLDVCDSFFSSLINVIEKIAKEHGYFITLIISRSEVKTELEGIKYLADRKVDGIILFPIAKGNAYTEMLKGLGIPVVTIYNRISGDFDHIDVDCRNIMKNAVSFIKNKGYDTIAYLDVGKMYLDDNKNVYSFEERRRGYDEGIASEHMEPVVFNGYRENEILSFINNKAGKKAILCAYDRFAVMVLSTCRQNGLRVPEDIGIMGFNNMEVLEHIYPRIYSVDCNITEIGKNAFMSLLEQMKGGKGKGDLYVPYTIAECESL